MRWAKTIGTAGLAELAAHFLSLGWGFMVLLAAFVFVAVHAMSAVATVTSKAVATEARVSALIPQVNSVSNVANAALPQAGGTVTGSLTVNGNSVTGGNQAVNGVLSGAGGGTLELSAAIHCGSSIQADTTLIGGGLRVNGTTITPAQGAPSGYPIAHGTPWENQVIDIINATIGNLRNSGIF